MEQWGSDPQFLPLSPHIQLEITDPIFTGSSVIPAQISPYINLPLHPHTISPSSTRLQRCIFSSRRMRASTAYVQLYHPGKSWSEGELSHESVLSPTLPQFWEQFSSQTLPKCLRALGASPPLCSDPSGATKVGVSTFNSQPSPTPPTSRYFLGMPPAIKCFLSILLTD